MDERPLHVSRKDTMGVRRRAIRADLPGRSVTPRVLQAETESLRGTGGISAEIGSLGFRPAFLDLRTEAIYASRCADGLSSGRVTSSRSPEHRVAGDDARS